MNATVATPAGPSESSPIEREVHRIRGLIQRGLHAESLAAAEALLAQVPENRDVLYMLAVSQRYLQQIPAALATLARLQSLHPGFSRLYQERGYCYVARKDAPRAIDALLTGVNINPALPASWSMLEGLYKLLGDAENARTAAAHVATLKSLPPEVVTATALFSDGDLSVAESVIRTYLLQHGNHVEAMRLLARIGIARAIYDDAEVLLAAVLELAPEYRAARHDYARALLERHKHQRAREELAQLIAQEPDNRQFLTLYATACVGVGEFEEAIGLYRRLLEDAPQSEELHLSVAHALKTLGRREESIASYRTAAAIRPNYGETYWSLANLKTYRFTPDEIAVMRAEEARPGTSLPDRYHLCFALGKALEDERDVANAWIYYERGNDLKRAQSRYRPETLETNTRLQIATCTAEFFAQRRGVGASAPDPIFIVGLPRSGSTLLEQILASHSRVEGTQELAEIPRIALDLQGRDPDLDHPRYPGVLAQLPVEEFARLGERYLRDTRVYRGGRALFIDKMPNNFRHLGLIHLILPNAKIIDARREPMACCFSNFKQLFASGQEFTYGISDIARYYRTYLDLMGHWTSVLPGRVLRVQHEDVVEDLEANVRRLLEFCELEFEPACVEFHKTERSVRTASSEQVRRPIFRDGLDQWKHFSAFLGPLEQALGDALVRYRE